MFPYTVKYTESEHDIQNINVLYKVHQKCQNAFETLDSFEQIRKNSKSLNCQFVLYINSINHILYFCKFCIFYNYVYFVYNICTYIQKIKYDIGNINLMVKCFEHETTFLDTHCYFRPAIEISRKCPIVGGGPGAIKLKHILDLQLMQYHFMFSILSKCAK